MARWPDAARRAPRRDGGAGALEAVRAPQEHLDPHPAHHLLEVRGATPARRQSARRLSSQALQLARARATRRAQLGRRHRLASRGARAAGAGGLGSGPGGARPAPPASKRWTYGELIVGIAMHDAYHTGQIQLVKRLWQERRSRRCALHDRSRCPAVRARVDRVVEQSRPGAHPEPLFRRRPGHLAADRDGAGAGPDLGARKEGASGILGSGAGRAIPSCGSCSSARTRARTAWCCTIRACRG